jgi:hypothetical protein
MYSTPYLIWSNKHNIRIGDGGTISPYFLAGMALEAAGLPLNDFYKTLRDYRSLLPVSRSFIAIGRQGQFINELSESEQKYLDAHKAYSRSLLY